MRLLLTGASGQLGRAFLAAAASAHEVIPLYHAPPADAPAARVADLADPAGLRATVRDARPDWVVHAAAMTNVDACERDPALADRLNGHATGALARAAQEAGARFLYVSTDYVFDGSAGPYHEGDAPHPVQAYGRSKLLGEREALAASPRAVIARTAVVYGPHKKNFVTWLLDELRAGRRVRIVEDQWVTPTHTRDLSEQLLALVQADAEGTYHTAGGEGCTRLAMAHAVADAFGLPRTLIDPIKTAELQWLAERPRDSRLDTTKITALKRPYPLNKALAILKEELHA